MTRNQLYLFLFFIMPLIHFLSTPIATGDLAIWVAQGKSMIDHQEILKFDPFSFLETRPVVYPFLICLIYGLLDLIGGLYLVGAVHKFSILLILFLIYKNSISLLVNKWNGSKLLLYLFVLIGISFYFVERPALIALIPFLISYQMIEDEKYLSIKGFIKLIITLILWTNIHGSWPLLIAMFIWKSSITIYLKNQPLRTHLITISRIFILLVATLCNPFGYKMWLYVFETARTSRLRGFDEWDITTLSTYFPMGLMYYILFIFLITIFYFKLKNKEFNFLSSPFIFLLFLGATGIRHIEFSFLLLLIFLVKYQFLKDNSKLVTYENSPKLNLIFSSILILIACTLLPWSKPYFRAVLPKNKQPILDEMAPVEAVQKISESNSKNINILNDWEYGSYLAYSLTNKIYVDTRNIIYFDKDFNDYLNIMNNKADYTEFTQKHNIGFILLNTQLRSIFISKLSSDIKWQLIYSDKNTTLFKKSDILQ